LIRTSRPTRSERAPTLIRNPRGGFTLVELLVVIGLIALITLVAMPSITSYTKLSLSAASRELATTVREAYNSTVLTGRVHRVVYDIKNGEYWVEKGPPTLLMDTAETEEREKRRKRFAKEDDKPKTPSFVPDKTIARGKASLPRGVIFKDVITERSPDPVTEGKAYTHIFPHGLSEQTIVHIQDLEKHNSTLVLETIAGKTRVIDNAYKDRKEVFGE
jgi:prepilin-type N-terminal cleavage/methylation domain-containing protein